MVSTDSELRLTASELPFTCQASRFALTKSEKKSAESNPLTLEQQCTLCYQSLSFVICSVFMVLPFIFLLCLIQCVARPGEVSAWSPCAGGLEEMLIVAVLVFMEVLRRKGLLLSSRKGKDSSCLLSRKVKFLSF